MPASGDVRFESGATVVTVPGPPSQTDAQQLAQFVSSQSANHTRWSYKLTGSGMWQWTVPLQGLNGAQKAGLQSFFTTTVGGPGNQFTYTHTNGSSYQVSFVDTALTWTRHNGEFWDVTIRLETATEPN